MKLIIAGASGFVASELLRQSLRRPEITSVIALARKPVSVPENLGPGADASKLKSVVLEDYGHYPDDVKKEFAGADACIWTVAITPSKSKAYEFEEVRRICQTCAVDGLKAAHEAGPAKPFRFIYMSGSASERDQTKTPRFLPQYCLMRGETETKILEYAAKYEGEIEACSVRPGLITGQSIMRSIMATALSATIALPSITVQALSAAMLDQVLNGFTKEPLENGDLAKLGNEVLKREAKAQV